MSDEPKNETPPKPAAEWQHREFAINGRMKEICHLGIEATRAEITALKRKLEKLQYGS
jgi:hypothetical protein